MPSSRLGELLSGARAWPNSRGPPADTEVRRKKNRNCIFNRQLRFLVEPCESWLLFPAVSVLPQLLLRQRHIVSVSVWLYTTLTLCFKHEVLSWRRSSKRWGGTSFQLVFCSTEAQNSTTKTAHLRSAFLSRISSCLRGKYVTLASCGDCAKLLVCIAAHPARGIFRK